MEGAFIIIIWYNTEVKADFGVKEIFRPKCNF